ncbi:RagB/SusD family nutrient uptake outer membrane protein [Mucilaginibacter sp.]
MKTIKKIKEKSTLYSYWVDTKYKTKIIVILLLLNLSACKKLAEVNAPPNLLTSNEVFNNDQTATSAVLGIYAKMMAGGTNITNSAASAYTGLSSDELRYIPVTNANITQFFSNDILSTNSIISSNFWNFGYQTIYQANSCIGAIKESKALTLATQNQLLGECELTRAFVYFYMVNIFGGVPLVTGTDYVTNSTLPRASSDAIYKQIIADLTDAQRLLNENYPEGDKLRPNKWAATALLARVYLYQRNWQQAQSMADLVINSGTYSLESDANNVFSTTSNEAIWQMTSVVSGVPTPDGQIFLPSSTTVKPNFALTDNLLNAFEPGDKRKVDWVKSNNVSGQNYSYPFKYQVRSSVANEFTQYYTIMRLAEQYLIRAESNVYLNKLTDAKADLNIVRSRAGLANTTATTSQDIITAIQNERRIEFFAEWGDRWFNLKRTATADSVLQSEKVSWKSTDALYPIPQSQIQSNSALKQNPGY